VLDMSRKRSILLMLTFALSTVSSTATGPINDQKTQVKSNFLDTYYWVWFKQDFKSFGRPNNHQESNAKQGGGNPSDLQGTGAKPTSSGDNGWWPNFNGNRQAFGPIPPVDIPGGSLKWLAFKCVFWGDCNFPDIATRSKAWVNAKMPYVRDVSGVIHHFPENLIHGTIGILVRDFKKDQMIVYCTFLTLMRMFSIEIHRTILCVSGNSFAMNIITCILILKRGAACTEALLSDQTEHLSDAFLCILFYNVHTLIFLNYRLCNITWTNDQVTWLYQTSEQLIYRRIMYQVAYRGWCPFNILVIVTVIFAKRKRWGPLLKKVQWDQQWQGAPYNLTFSALPFYVFHLSYLLFIDLGCLPIWYWSQQGSSWGHKLLSNVSWLLGLFSLWESDVSKLCYAALSMIECGIKSI
jgi:hypothetical protein